MKYGRSTIAVTAIATSLVAAAPASAAYMPTRYAVKEATEFARVAYTRSDEAVDYGYDECIRHSGRRVSCDAVVGYDTDGNNLEDMQCVTRVYTTLGSRSRYATSYGRPTASPSKSRPSPAPPPGRPRAALRAF